MAKFIEPMFSEHISGLATQRRGEPLLDGHVEAAAGRDVDDRVGRLLDAGQKLHEDGRIRRRATVLGITGVQMQNRGTRFRGCDRLRRNVIRSERQSVRHRRRMNAARHGARDDDLVRFGRRQSRHSPVKTGAPKLALRCLITRRRKVACSSGVHL